MRKVQDANLVGKKVLLIVDYNVNTVEESISCFKIEQTRNTIDYILSQSPSVLVISTHLGRPKNASEYSVSPLYSYLKKIYPSTSFLTIRDIRETPSILDLHENKSKNMQNQIDIKDNRAEGRDSRLYFTDNTRYYSLDMLSEFSNLFEITVSDAFGSAHRRQYFTGYSGFLMQKEVECLSNLDNCDLLILGGAKVKDKAGLILRQKSHVFLGGLIAIEFIKFRKRILNKEFDAVYESIDRTLGDNLILPDDFLVEKGDSVECVSIDEIDLGSSVIDIGYRTVDKLHKIVNKKKLIFWNGPLGDIDDSKSISTNMVPKILANCAAKVIIGGGETTASALKYETADKFYHVSTGGGSMLAFLTNEEMPGINCLCN